VTYKEFIKKLQAELNKLGEGIAVDGVYGPKTSAALDKYEFDVLVKRREPKTPPIPTLGRSENPAYVEAKKYDGKKESDNVFGGWLSTFWAGVGLKNYKTIIGTTFAWCGLFIFAMNTEVGQKAISGAAGAKNWAKYGVEINWKQDGIPKGAVMHINANCGSGSGNHVTFADGDCSAADLLNPGATVPGFGGNQGNMVKRSNYAASSVCAVRWPSEIPKPDPITKSVNCSKGNLTGESTK